MGVYELWEAIQPFRELIILLGVLLTIAKVAWDVSRGTAFITKVLSDPPIGWLRAAGKIGLLLTYAPSLIVDFRGERLSAARYLAELEILKPKARSPNPRDYRPREFQRVLKEWSAGEQQRRASITALIRHHFYVTRPGVWGSIGRGLKRLTAKFRKPDGLALDPTTVVPIDDFPSLDDSRVAIKRYFDVLGSMGYRDATFVSSARLEVGYLAPLFLITGLINRFTDEDGWKLILNNYRQLVRADEKYSLELRELRSFMFNCWLLWGPSVAPCSCPLWIPKDPSCKNDLIIQYGFGDENNSIDLIVKNGRGIHFATSLENRLNPSPKEMDDADFTPIALCAAPYRVRGSFRWGPDMDDAKISEAQRFIQGGASGSRKPLNGRIVMECRDLDVEIADASLSAKYYSAYLWIMFVILDCDGKPHFSQRWKNLLVYFEHANIADASTYQTLKENLISKASSSLTEILGRRSDMERVAIRYACAFDDSYCGPSDSVLFPPHQGLAGMRSAGLQAKRAKLIDILRETTLRLPADHVLNSGRLCLPETSRPCDPNGYASCHLPEIIEEFYGELQEK